MLQIYSYIDERGKGFDKLGEFSYSRFISLINELPIYSEVEDCVGIYRGDFDEPELDYIDFCKEAPSVYRLTTDRLVHDGPIWKRLLVSDRISKKLDGIQAVQAVVQMYAAEPRGVFEKHYI